MRSSMRMGPRHSGSVRLVEDGAGPSSVVPRNGDGLGDAGTIDAIEVPLPDGEILRADGPICPNRKVIVDP